MLCVSVLHFIAEQCSVIQTSCNMFTNSPVGRHLGCFQFGVIVNILSMITGMQVFVWTDVFISVW